LPGQLPEYRCRICGSAAASLLLDFGRVPLANAFTGPQHPDADRIQYPLTLVQCEGCGMVQIKEILPPAELFTTYPWVSGTSATLREYAKEFAGRIAGRVNGGGDRFLLEIASNDGSMLAACREAGFDVLGVDPSNVTEEAVNRGIPTIRAFFGTEVAERIVADRGRADVVVARNVIGHVAEPNDLVAGIRRVLAPAGRAFIETPYALRLRQELQYDTVFHEHVCYLTIGTLTTLLGRHGLEIADLSFVSMNGGSFLAEVRHRDAVAGDGARSVLDLEEMLELNRPRGWEGFAAQVDDQRRGLVRLLTELRAAGAVVVAYGAAAKFMTMLNYCGITPDLVAACGDANPRKEGLLCPGVRIPVESPATLMARRPDYVLIGAWNFRDEIIRFFREQLGYRGRFIVPLPVARVVS
jgi:SAM-dependent methyltransferase